MRSPAVRNYFETLGLDARRGRDRYDRLGGRFLGEGRREGGRIRKGNESGMDQTWDMTVGLLKDVAGI